MLLFGVFCGGLVAPESDTNLWNLRFWAPRNVVLAVGGQQNLLRGTYTFRIVICLEEQSFWMSRLRSF
jgi:hypothetical protein